MEQDKMLAVMGSPGSGKTTAAVKLALTLAAQKKNVVVVFCDPFAPVIPAILPAAAIHDTSLGELLTAPSLSQTDILNACIPVEESGYISLLGYRAGESLMNYPKITRDKVVEFFVMLRYLADYIIIDCSAVFEADPTSIIAIELADRVLKLGTANLKGISYYQTHNIMLADSRFRKDTHQIAIGNQKVGQDWEAVQAQYCAGQHMGVHYVLPYTVELERQDNELALFKPLTEPESSLYTAEIAKILSGIFSVQTAKAPAKEKTAHAQAAKVGKLAGTKPGFKFPFSKNKGEF